MTRITLGLVTVGILSACGADLRESSTWPWGIAHDVIVDPQKYDVSEAPHGIRGVRIFGSIVWIVPVQRGVVLVDTGFDESGEKLAAELDGEEVRAILLTHSHIDHTSGSHNFSGTPVYVHQDDYDAMFTAGQNGVPGIQLLEWMLGRPPVPDRLIDVADRRKLLIDGALFHAVHLPGHTPGSTAWLFRDVLFSGDALTVGPGADEALEFRPCPDYPVLSRSHFRRLLELDIEVVLDGHWGQTYGVAAKLRAARAEPL